MIQVHRPPKVTLPGGTAAPRLGGTQKPLSRGFLSNLKDFLTERPVKIAKNGGRCFHRDGFGGGLAENFKEWFKPTPKAVSSRMTVDWQPPYKVLWQNIRDLISPPKLPPLKVTSQPVKVKDIWSKDKAFGPSQAIALALHIGITVLIFSPLLYEVAKKVTANPSQQHCSLRRLIFPTYYDETTSRQRQGRRRWRWRRTKSHSRNEGKAPKWSMTQIAPPMVHTKPDSKIQATLLGPPDLKIPSPNMDNFGDPLAKMMNDSGGPGGGSGIGSGTGTGIGSGEGGGLGPGSGGGTGGGAYRPGTGGVGYPSCVYCPDPKYSEEARKAKYQGTVVLQAVITADGRATEIQVVKGPGLGLEEKAVEAVKQWRFKPAMGPGGKASPRHRSHRSDFPFALVFCLCKIFSAPVIPLGCRLPAR